MTWGLGRAQCAHPRRAGGGTLGEVLWDARALVGVDALVAEPGRVRGHAVQLAGGVRIRLVAARDARRHCWYPMSVAFVFPNRGSLSCPGNAHNRQGTVKGCASGPIRHATESKPHHLWGCEYAVINNQASLYGNVAPSSVMSLRIALQAQSVVNKSM